MLLKSTTDYKIKSEEFEKLLYSRTLESAQEFTVKQLELVVWAFAKRLKSDYAPLSRENEELRNDAIRRLCEVLKLRSASMKARGVSFAVEAITDFYTLDG